MKPLAPQQSLMEITVNRIREAIISGELPLGSKLSEQKLAETLGISRSPVHNALALLQYEGLVVVQPNVGSFVFTPSVKEALDLCEHRAVLETASLRLALDLNPDHLIDGLVASTSVMQEAARNGDTVSYTKGDMSFHEHIVGCSGNSSMARTYPHTIGPLMALRTHLFTNLNAHPHQSLAEHEALIDACRRGEVEDAVAILKTHISHLIEMYQKTRNKVAAGH